MRSKIYSVKWWVGFLRKSGRQGTLFACSIMVGGGGGRFPVRIRVEVEVEVEVEVK